MARATAWWSAVEPPATRSPDRISAWSSSRTELGLRIGPLPAVCVPVQAQPLGLTRELDDGLRPLTQALVAAVCGERAGPALHLGDLCRRQGAAARPRRDSHTETLACARASRPKCLAPVRVARSGAFRLQLGRLW